MIKIQQIVKPFNSGFSAVSIKYLLEDLQKRYLQNIKPELVCKAIKIKNDYFVYFQIPSESNSEYPSDKVHYDVILQLVPPNASWLESENLRDFDVRVYSNCPSFTFTFTYVYYKQGALINMPHGAYTRKALNTKPVTRNPLLLYGIEKSLWFAICYMDENHLFRRSKLDAMITDDKTGVDFAYAYYTMPLSRDTKQIQLIYNSSTQKYEGTYFVTNKSENGKWMFATIQTADKAGHYTYIRENLGNGDFTVYGTTGADWQGPVVDLSTLQVNKKSAINGESIRMSVNIIDDILRNYTFVNRPGLLNPSIAGSRVLV